MYPYNLLKNAVVVFIKGKPYTIEASHPNYEFVRTAIKTADWASLPDLVDIPAAVVRASHGLVQVMDGLITYKGKAVNSHLAARILEFMSQGFDTGPWVKFMDKLYSNPDTFSIQQLYGFLERAKLPITPDGDFLAYKYVRSDYFDCYSGRFDNSPGKVVEEDRARCDNNPDNHCSRGLHFCAKDYLQMGGGYRQVIVKVNPRDVVSVPNDHNFQKARACRYVVVGELGEDYSIEDMESKAVLPDPRNAKEINTAQKATRPLEDRIVKYINRHLVECVGCDITVRQVASALKVNNAAIVANIGNKVFIYKNSSKAGTSLSNQRVGVKKAFKKEGL
jgi:hypothetical protein